MREDRDPERGVLPEENPKKRDIMTLRRCGHPYREEEAHVASTVDEGEENGKSVSKFV